MSLVSMVITDLTRMKGDRVCIAGVTDDGKTIRPKFAHSTITEEWLFDRAGKVVIQPFARVRLELMEQDPHPPHTEDWFVRPDVKISEGLLGLVERQDLLRRILDPNVAAIFGAEIYHENGYFMRGGEGNCSLGTVRVSWLEDVSHRCYDDKWDYRISFTDCAGNAYRLGVTDLAFRYYIDHLREVKGVECDQIGISLARQLQGSTVYLRIGLARGWEKYPDRCYLQINGVYSFPDYLEERCFADFVNQG